MSEVEKLLRKAKARIRRGWCQLADARDKDGVWTWPTRPTARAWCAYGALIQAYPADADSENAAFNLMCRAIRTRSITRWNDKKGRTKTQVLAAFDRAILLAQTLSSSSKS